MSIKNFIKKLIMFDVIWGARTKKLTGVNDANNFIETNITINDSEKSIDLGVTVPSYFRKGTYFRTFGTNNQSSLFQVDRVEGTKIFVVENINTDVGNYRVDARLWVVHDDENISKESSTGGTMFNANNATTTGLECDGSGLARQLVEHYHTPDENTNPGGGDGTRIVEYFTLNNAQFTNKEVVLSQNPLQDNQVILDIVGGVPQNYGTDFQVSGTTLTWNGLDLDVTLCEGSIIRVIYKY